MVFTQLKLVVLISIDDEGGWWQKRGELWQVGLMAVGGYCSDTMLEIKHMHQVISINPNI